MMRVFIDSSVLIAASYSSTGASREIIRQGIRGKIELVISNLVLEEICDFASYLPPGLYPTHAGSIRTTDAQDVTDSPITGQKSVTSCQSVFWHDGESQ